MIDGVQKMQSCYRKIVVEQQDVVMIVISWHKRVMITQSPLTRVMWAPCPCHQQGMQSSYKTYSNSNCTWPFCQSNCTLVSLGHKNDKSYLFLPNYHH